ncbi:hypothetical protein N658DRAFT_492184 [Parathielavia hyrcaniae]|uniref:Uncharacterized protein n=1 Tax=Parathielavia hyrcaniae TaxID=113614 RepID=A0AAN6Q8P0_9PEZI|nr:hypothetical protein N658DRAFT_492184 [Parathielavia hyrcaniae]
MTAQRFEYFFDLPPELREQILSHLCLFPTGINVGGGVDGKVVPMPAAPASNASISTAGAHQSTHHTSTSSQSYSLLQVDEDKDENEDDENCAEPPINLFLASPVLYREAGDLYYGRNVFHLNCVLSLSLRRRVPPRQSSALSKLLNDRDTSGARWRIRSAVVYVKRLGGLVQLWLGPVLGKMVLNGALRRVRVDVLAGRSRADPSPVMADFASNPALRALLKLLTDPDMEKAELRVPRRDHARFWCRFHPGGVSEYDDGDVACQMVSGRHLSGHGDEFVPVDIHRLVDVCAGDAAEFKIKRVGVRGS